MASPAAKKLLMTVLVACFLVQTALVYTDRKAEPLSEQALQGRRLWHENACQVCHQLYGQGGFLGPDLTNAASRMDEARLTSLLTVGSGQMPALGFGADQITQITAFLEAMDRPDLGRGQLRLGDPDAGQDEASLFARAVDAATAPQSPEAQGFAAFSGRSCTACHQPFRTSAVGAPDLSTAAERLTPGQLRAVLTDGRPTLGMPTPIPPFSPEELDTLVAYLSWLRSNREAVQAAMSAGARRRPSWSAIPWWTFK